MFGEYPVHSFLFIWRIKRESIYHKAADGSNSIANKFCFIYSYDLMMILHDDLKTILSYLVGENVDCGCV